MSARTKVSVIAFALLLTGCASVQSIVGSADEEPTFPTPVLMVKPDIDYSGETPGCMVAAQRLVDNVEVGMTLKDVTRLVGKPRYKITGSWWWSKSFSKSGKPRVRFDFQRGQDDTVITGIDTDTSGCEPG